MLLLEAEYKTLETKDGDVVRAKCDLAISTSTKSEFIRSLNVVEYN